MEKVVLVEGDISEPGFGISPENRRLLTENVDIIIHNAGVIHFNKVEDTLKTNVWGTKRMLELAAECSHLKIFIYVSTAYSHCYLKNIEEKFYEPPGDLKMVNDILEANKASQTGIADAALEDILGKWPNVYTFSKSIAESLVENAGKTAPFACIVFRPSIVITTMKEPIKSWLRNIGIVEHALMGIMFGILRVNCVKRDTCLDVVPADMVANALLTLIWYSAEHRKSKGAEVYNYCSSVWNKLHTNTGCKQLISATEKYPCMKAIWYHKQFMIENWYVFIIFHLLLHGIPAVVGDLVLLACGKKPRATKIFVAVTRNLGTFNYYLNSNWTIQSTKMQGLLAYMNTADQEEFPCDLGKVNWGEIIELHVLGVRQFLLKESMDTIPAAKKKQRNIAIMHHIACTLLVLILLYSLYRICVTIL